MSAEDARINLLVALLVLPPFMALAAWAFRRTPLHGLQGVAWWQALRIRIAASAMLLLGTGMILWFLGWSLLGM